jgi:phosphoglycolate phosphatase
MNDSVDQIFLFDGIKELLAQLSTRGTRLAVVTSNSRQNVQQVLGKETAALVEYYECGVGLFGKRDRFQKILKKSGFSREEIICIGDETRDIDAARSANLICAAVAWGYAGLDVLEAHKPNFIFFNVEQLAQAILE